MSSHQLIMENWRNFLDNEQSTKKQILNERSGKPVPDEGQSPITMDQVEVYGCAEDSDCPPGMICGGNGSTCVAGSNIPGMNDFAWTQVFLDKVMSESEGYQNFAQKWNDVSKEILLGLLPHMPRNMSWRELGKTALDLALIFCGWKLIKMGGKGILRAGRWALDKMGAAGNLLKELGKKGLALMNSTQIGKFVTQFVKFVATNKGVHNIILSVGLGLLGGAIAMNFVEKYSDIMNRKVTTVGQYEALDDESAIFEAEEFVVDKHGLLRCDDGALIDPEIEGAACPDGSNPSRQSAGENPSGKMAPIPPNMMVCNVPEKYAYKGFSTYLVDKFREGGCPEPGSEEEESLFLRYVYKTYGRKQFGLFLGDETLRAYEASQGIREVITKYRESRKVHPAASRQWWFDA